jgi:hypothetical protein
MHNRGKHRFGKMVFLFKITMLKFISVKCSKVVGWEILTSKRKVPLQTVSMFRRKKKIQPATFFDREPFPTNPKVNMQCSLRYPFALIFMLKGFGAIFPWICYGTWLC